MVDFLVIGTIAWDRPIYMEGNFTPGTRILGKSLEGNLAGRLGGGAANAGSALIGAGYTVSIGSYVRQDEEGERILKACIDRGMDVSLVSEVPASPKGRSIILIDGTGERSVLYLDYKMGQLAAVNEALKELAPPLADIEDKNPKAVYARGPHPGFDSWLGRTQIPVLAHWPWKANSKVAANLLVGSTDDLGLTLSSSTDELFSAATRAATNKLEWAVVTEGKNGALATNGTDRIEASPPIATQIDTTGAGDVFSAGLLEAWTAGAAMEEALPHACSWGSTSVQLKNSSPDINEQCLFKPFAELLRRV